MATQTKVSPTFRTFRDLPKELRDLILDLAIQNRDVLPQANFYAVDSECHYSISTIESGPFGDEWTEGHLRLKCPSRDSSNVHSTSWRSQQNPSGYMADSGLWNACVESRDAVARRWAKCHGRSPYKKLGSWNTTHHVLSARVHKGSDVISLTSHPQWDLLCFQALENWGDQDLDDVHSMAGYSLNIGFEYDPEWDPEAFYTHDCDKLKVKKTALGGLAKYYSKPTADSPTLSTIS